MHLLMLVTDRIANMGFQFLGSLTTAIGCLCLFLLGTPSEVRWLTQAEKDMVRKLLYLLSDPILIHPRPARESSPITPATTAPP